MDQRQKLEPFLLLVKNAKGKAAADLIQKVTAEPGIFAFSELTQFQGIKELQGTDLDAAYQLLNLFCYGTWADYKGMADQIKLEPAQIAKLKQLTVVSMARNTQKLSYADLMQQLEIDSIRDLEDLLISDCFHSGLISGKLDQKQQCLYITNAAARDVRPEELQGIVDQLLQWLQKSKATLTAVDDAMKNVQSLSKQAKDAQVAADNEISQAVQKFQPVSTPAEMEISEPETASLAEISKPESSKKAGLAGSKRRR